MAETERRITKKTVAQFKAQIVEEDAKKKAYCPASNQPVPVTNKKGELIGYIPYSVWAPGTTSGGR